MLFKTFSLGQLQTNCYLLTDETGHAVIVDPAEHGDRLADMLEKENLTLDAICLTHAHYDHIGGLARLQARTGAPVYLHQDDLSIVTEMSGGLLTVGTQAYPRTLRAGNMEITVHHTPGHSPGSVCLQTGDTLLCGDTLFFGSCGRTDFVGGSWEQMAASLRFLGSMNGNFTVCPGHGEPTTLDTERKYNPYMQEAMRK